MATGNQASAQDQWMAHPSIGVHASQYATGSGAPPPMPKPANPFDIPELQLAVERLAVDELRNLAADHANKASSFWQSALDQSRSEFKEAKDKEEKDREAKINLVISIAMLAGGPLLTAASGAAARVLNGQELSTRLNVSVNSNIAQLAQSAGLTDAQSREVWIREAREKLAMNWISAKLETFDESKAQAGIAAAAAAVKDKTVQIAAETDEKKLGVAYCDELQRAQNESMNSLLNTIRAQDSAEALIRIYDAFATATVGIYKAALSAQIANFNAQIARVVTSRAEMAQGRPGKGSMIVQINAYGRMRFAHVIYMPSSATFSFESWVTPDMESMAAQLSVKEIDPRAIVGHLPAPELQPNPARVVQMDAWGAMRLAIVSVSDEGYFVKDYGVMQFVSWVPDRDRAQAEAKGRAQVGGINTVSPGAVKGLREPA